MKPILPLLLAAACGSACVPRRDLDDYARDRATGDPNLDAAVEPSPPPPGSNANDAGDAASNLPSVDDTDNFDASRSDAAPATADASVPLGPDAGTPVVPTDAQASVCAAEELLGPDGHCHFLQPGALVWATARTACRARGPGWDLSSVRSAAESEFLAEVLGFEAWLGASDETEEATWVWVVDETPFWSGSGTTGSAIGGEYTNWNSDEPNGGIATNCVRVVPALATDAGAPWADLGCEQELGAVCELYVP